MKFTTAIVIIGIFCLPFTGCGKAGSVTAPSGSKIITDPASVSINISGDTIVNFKVAVQDKAGQKGL